MNTINRRQFTALAAATLAGAAHAQQPPVRQPYVADMHSHYGMFLPRFSLDLGKHMRENGVTLLSWAVVDDRPWITASGALRQVAQPQPGDIRKEWERLVADYEGKLAKWQLAKALTPADIDASLAGEPRVLLACESANFLEGHVEGVAQAHAKGVRHLQLVHYIRSPLGDHQTDVPAHGGLTPVGAQVVAECKRLGILVDMAHGTPSLVDGVLAASDAVPIWSHSWISPNGGTHSDPGYIARSLGLAVAKKIAARGGVIGLWCLRLSADYPVKSKGNYADEIMRMCDLVGPEHVAFGTDMEGVWPSRVLNDYDDLRDVVENLLKRGLPESTLQAVFIGNYARVVKAAMAGAART
jgi:membrane dipeptidase